jgi:23S rRNA (cytidine1920-2'-O)/16S rRNA (cytidine1409-2'-O)-methyltransferase
MQSGDHKKKSLRADMLLLKQGLCESREDAKKLILAGSVRIGSDRVIKKASETFPEDTVFNVEKPIPYVSRGAYKLIPALDKFLPEMNDMTALDVGASTGGFTDLMLQRGARKVYAVDSGRGQLHAKLRNDERVICHEKVNARHLESDFLPEKVDALTMDVSFISATKILPAVAQFLKKDAWAFILIKPQFEAERQDVGKGGVVRDESIREKCIQKVVEFAENNLSWKLMEILPSPIKGPKGNQEYIAVFKAENN